MPKKTVVLLSKEKKKSRVFVQKVCVREGISLPVLEELVDVELGYIGRLRKVGLHDKFNDILDRIVEVQEQ